MTKAKKKQLKTAGLVIVGIIALPFVLVRLFPSKKSSIVELVPVSLQKFL